MFRAYFIKYCTTFLFCMIGMLIVLFKTKRLECYSEIHVYLNYIVGMTYPFIPGLDFARTVQVGVALTDRLILPPLPFLDTPV